MLFTDALFLPFLAAVFLLWLPWGGTGRKVVLTAASLFFYAGWDVRFLGPLAYVWLIVFTVPQLITRAETPATRRRWLLLGVTALLGLLFVFKYLGFFLDTLRPLMGPARPPGPILRLMLPVGVSFYTFLAIGYVVDAYRRKFTPSRSALDTALAVAFFPLLLAGPIERGARWLPQLAARQPLRADNLRDALERMILGYLLKVAVADPIAPFCNDIFSRAAAAGSGELVAGVFLYSLQIFTDFAGYSLIARGAAKLFGYEVVNNFEQPYFSRSFSEFWRRWHISLSTWIWDYLFNPLVSAFLRRLERFKLKSVEQEMRIAYPIAAMITMLLCGLWHGAGWTYVVWGGLHGAFLSAERLFVFGNRTIRKRPRIRGVLDVVRAASAALLVFVLVSLAWVVFRAASLEEAGQYLRRMFTAGGWVVQRKTLVLLVAGYGVTALVQAIEYARQDEWVFRGARGWLRGFAYAAALIYIVLMGGTGGKVPFIYFQF